MDRSDISNKLKVFIETECSLQVPYADTALDIDSFNMMLIITFVGEELGVTLSLDNIDFDDRISLCSLTDLIVGDATS